VFANVYTDSEKPAFHCIAISSDIRAFLSSFSIKIIDLKCILKYTL